MLLVRHGETEWNVQGRWQGHSDSELTERGVRQAKNLAEALAEEEMAAVYCSDLRRAQRTAEIVATAHGLAPVADHRLREVDTGDWTGHLASDLEKSHPREMAAWRTAPASLDRLPGGEGLAEVQRRLVACLIERLPPHAGQAVLVVTHGAAAQCILARALGRPLSDLWLKEGRVDNCQISRLEWTAEHGLRVVELADARHLAEVGGLQGWGVLGDRDQPVETASRG